MPLFRDLTCADIRGLEPLVRSHVYRAGEMIHGTGDKATSRFEQAQQTIRQLSTDSAKQRVAAALLALADKLGVTQDGVLVLEFPLTRVDVSGLTGLSAETVSRVMSRLRDDGIVDTGRRWTAILDRTRLATEVAE